MGVPGEVNAMGIVAKFWGPYGLVIQNNSIWVVDFKGGTVRNIGMLYCFPIQINNVLQKFLS